MSRPVVLRCCTLLLLAAVSLAFPLPAAQAVPCDAHSLGDTPLPRYNLPVIVATDEAWQQAHGDRAGTVARYLIGEAARILEPTGIDLVVTGYRTWSTDDGEGSMSWLLERLEASVPAGPSHLVIGLTGHQTSRADGIAHVGHIHLVARRHPGRPQYDTLVVAHEIGHLLGAEHHHCHHEYRCIMAPKGFGLPARWCAHHVQEIQLHAARLLAE